jgi:hypothetical protein
MPSLTDEKRHDKVVERQSMRNLILARRLVTPLLPAPAVRWPPESETYGELGHGIWRAEGVVLLQAPAAETNRWTAIFVPGHPQPLYLRVGSHETGDLASALAQAHAR